MSFDCTSSLKLTISLSVQNTRVVSVLAILMSIDNSALANIGENAGGGWKLIIIRIGNQYWLINVEL